MSGFATFLAYLIVGGIFLVFVGALANMLGAGRGPQLVCTRCGHSGRPKMQTRGSFGIELVLWICFIIPGLIYSLWRVGSRRRICEKCGSPELVPQDTPVGQRLMRGD